MNARGETTVSVIIPVLNAERYIDGCLGALARLNTPREQFEVIIIDNGSSDATLAKAAGFKKELRLSVYSRPGVNISALRNHGTARASGRLFAFLDADCVVSGEWMNKGIAAFSGVTRPAIAGSRYLIPPDSTWVGRAWNLNKSNKQVEGNVEWLPSGNMFVSKSVFNEVGGFDERIQTNEDYELCQRIRERGYSVFSDPGIEVVHLGTPQTIASFFGKERWHGRDVFKVFLESGTKFKNLKAVSYALFYLAAILGIILGSALALFAGSLTLLTISLFAIIFVPAGLAVRNTGGVNGLTAGLGVLYLVYGIARAACILEYGKRKN
jgi:glycosyltransferase involved in cell wall biosynthesis